MSSMRVLVIGCGYVGLPLAAELAGQGYEVFGLRRSAEAAAEMQAAGVKWVPADITRPSDLAQVPGPFDWVINTVSSAHGGGVDAYRKVYLDGTRAILEWLRSQPPRKYVYTSSTGVYGQTDGAWVDELAPTAPAAPTAEILLQTEQLLLHEVASEGFPGVVLRLSGIYGPGRSYWLQQLLRGEAQIPGDGTRYMNMVHREDVIGAIVASLAKGEPGEVINVSDDAPVTHLEFFQWLAGRLKRPLPPFAPDGNPGRLRGVTNKRVSNQKLKTMLSYRFRYPTYREGYEAELPEQG